MANKIFSVDIQQDLITAVLLQESRQSCEILGYAVKHSDFSGFAAVLPELMDQVGFIEGVCRVSIGAELFFFRNLSLPFADPKKINKVVPFELEESSPLDLDGLQIDSLVGSTEDGQTTVLAALLASDILEDIAAAFKECGQELEMLSVSGLKKCLLYASCPDVPDSFLFIDVGLRRAIAVLVIENYLTLIRPISYDPGGQAGWSLDLENKTTYKSQHSKPDEVMERIGAAIRQTLNSVALKGCRADEIPVFIHGHLTLFPDVARQLENVTSLTVTVCDLAPCLPGLQVGDDNDKREYEWFDKVASTAVATGLPTAKISRDFNFCQGSFAAGISFSRYIPVLKKASIPLALVLTAVVAFFWYDYSTLINSRDDLKKQINGVYRQAVPDATRIVDPLQQLQAKIDEKTATAGGNRIQGSISALDVLAEVSRRIPATLDMKLVRIIIEPQGVRMKGITDTFNTVDIIKKNLSESDKFSDITIASANLAPKDKTIRFELKFATAKGEE